MQTSEPLWIEAMQELLMDQMKPLVKTQLSDFLEQNQPLIDYCLTVKRLANGSETMPLDVSKAAKEINRLVFSSMNNAFEHVARRCFTTPLARLALEISKTGHQQQINGHQQLPIQTFKDDFLTKISSKCMLDILKDGLQAEPTLSDCLDSPEALLQDFNIQHIVQSKLTECNHQGKTSTHSTQPLSTDCLPVDVVEEIFQLEADRLLTLDKDNSYLPLLAQFVQRNVAWLRKQFAILCIFSGCDGQHVMVGRSEASAGPEWGQNNNSILRFLDNIDGCRVKMDHLKQANPDWYGSFGKNLGLGELDMKSLLLSRPEFNGLAHSDQLSTETKKQVDIILKRFEL